MKESLDTVPFQTQVQAQSCFFSQHRAVLFDVTSSVLSKQAPLPTTAVHQVLTAQVSQQLPHPPSGCSFWSSHSNPAIQAPWEWQNCAEVALLLCHLTSPCPAVQPVLPLSGSCLVLQLRAGVSLLTHVNFYSTDLREIMLQNLHFSNPPICLRHS